MDASQVIDDIRSCLISSKGGVPISQINRDYRMIVGQSIPYSKLGYTSLENFLKAIPGLNVYPKGGDLVLEALPTKNTSHITAMVRGQKSSGPRRKISAPSYGIRNLRGFRTPFSTPLRRVTPEPVEKTKRPAPTPAHMASMPRSKLPPRLKALVTHGPPKPTPAPTTLARLPDAGSRKAPDTPPNLASMPLYVPESTISNHHILGPGGDATSVVSTVSDSSVFGSSVLRTPTGVLGRKSPVGVVEYRRHASEELTAAPLMTIHFPPLHPPRTNAQSRILRQVSLPPISLDNDVKMTPVSPGYNYGEDLKPVLSPSASTGNKSGGYCQLLGVYCKAKNLHEPEYKIIERFPKSKTKQIVCSIKVGPDHQFSSYPAECSTEEEAREVAAQEAVGSLERIHGVLGESLPISTDENLLVARIAQMVHDHPNGLWSLQLPADYRKLFREILPDGWLDVVRTSPLITIEHAVHDRIILLPNRSSSSSSNKEPRTSSASPVDLNRLSMTNSPDWKVELEADDGVTNGDAADIINGAVASLGQIKLPEDEYWNVYVSYATSTANLWVRLIGEDYSTLYDDIAAEMEMFYMDGGAVAQTLIPGHFYALQVDKCWHRVEIIELVEDEESSVKGTRFASCFFVDNGDDDTIEVSKFRILDSRFTKLPCQAVQCRLTGLDDFSPEVVEDLLLERIIGHNFVAKPAHGSLEDEPDGRPYPSLTLYDTSTDENVNLNEVLLEKIISETVPPSLLKNGKIQETFVPYIARSGAFFIQIPSHIFDYIAKAIDEFSSDFATDGDYSGDKIAAGVTAVFEEMIYLAKFQEDMVWYRAVKDTSKLALEYGKVWVKFVDFGNCELTSLKDLVLLPPAHPLSRLPPQAIECRLHNMSTDVQFSERGLKRCQEILPPEEPVLLKVISTSTDSAGRKCDVVEIFKRVQSDNLLASVSTTLSVEDDVFEKAPFVFPESESSEVPKSPGKTAKGSSNISSEPGKPRTLPAPKVPNVGELFDVHVTIAANPGNFTVQPWKDAGVFSDLMTSIQAVYSDSSVGAFPVTPEAAAFYRKPLKRSQLQEGGVYAALHDDQLWYRISISRLFEGQSPEEVMVSAYFVDYGDVAVMTLDKLRELAPEFCSVPYQAIKAKLSGVRPVHSDWSVEDCLRFQDMVCNKQFVATVVETGPDLIDPSDMVIGINLTDTSDPKVDMSIGLIFIDEGRAESC